MTSTERLKKHIDDIEKRRIAMFFHVQNTASTVNNRVYMYYSIIAISALAVLLVGQLVQNKDSFLILWSGIFAIIAMSVSLIQYLTILSTISSKLYSNICTMYKGYDDEFYILKKFNSGEIEENLIKQFYINKSKELERYECHVVKPNWFIWVNITLLIGAIIFLILA